MAAINVQGFVSSTKTPKIYLAVILGGAGASAAANAYKILLYGNMIESALTGSAPSFTVAAGTASLGVAVQCFGPDDAVSQFGRGSELALGAAAVFKQFPAANLWCVPVASLTAKASVVLTATGTPTAAASVTVYVNGKASVPAAIATSDSVTAVATAVATAILATPDMPCTAQFLVGVCTITAKEPGLRGNQMTVRVVLSSGSQSVNTTGSTLAATLVGSTLTLSSGAASGNVYKLAGGTGQDALATALTAVNPARYHRQACANIDTTALQALRDQLNTHAGVTVQQLEQGVAASVDTYANAVTMATSLNAARMQLAWLYNAENSPLEIAAQVAAARLYGDAVTGGKVIGEATDPAANLNGVQLAGIREQFAQADRATATQIESALNNGLTPLASSASNPGYTSVVASITTRFLDGSSQPNYSVWKTKVVSAADYVADDLRSFLANQYQGFKLTNDVAGNPPPKIANVTTPKLVKGDVFARLKKHEEDGVVENVDANASLLQVLRDGSTGRLLMEIPFAIIPDFDQAAGNVRPLA